MKIKVYSVRLQSLVSISPKAYKAIAFNGSEAIIPKSQVFGEDYEVQSSNAYWISAWILEKKELQYSTKKERIYNGFTDKIEIEEHITIEKIMPEAIEAKKTTPDESLIRPSNISNRETTEV